MKAKVFSKDSGQQLESDLNHFLSKNDIDVISVTQSVNQKAIFLTLIYTEN